MKKSLPDMWTPYFGAIDKDKDSNITAVEFSEWCERNPLVWDFMSSLGRFSPSFADIVTFFFLFLKCFWLCDFVVY
jgi:hypothetical protein